VLAGCLSGVLLLWRSSHVDFAFCSGSVVFSCVVVFAGFHSLGGVAISEEFSEGGSE
jgi:hypothetical protein